MALHISEVNMQVSVDAVTTSKQHRTVDDVTRIIQFFHGVNIIRDGNADVIAALHAGLGDPFLRPVTIAFSAV
jgi:hypothetical protein